MARYRINIDPKPPSKANINAFKDFDSLHRRYKVQSRYDFWRRLYRNPRYFAVLVALVSISVLVYQSSLEDPKPAQIAFISPPIPPKNIPANVQEFSSQEAQELSYANGSKLYVPSEAFVNEENQAVKGKVELRYREIRDAADMYIAGIPMEYDSAGQSYTLESAAMLEILAYSAGKPVFLKEGKSLEVEYFSPLSGNDFHVYHLDTTARNWVFEGKDLVRDADVNQLLPEKPELNYILDREADTFLTRNVRIPAQKPGRVFQLAVKNADQYRLLAGKQNLIWEYVELREFPDPWKSGALPSKAQEAEAKPYRAAGVFLLEVGGKKFVAKALLNASSFESAFAEYKAKLSAYEEARSAYDAQRRKAQAKLAEREAAMKAYQSQLAEWEKANKSLDSLMQKGVYRKFIIRRLGINQLGRKLNYPLMSVSMKLSLEDDDSFGQKLSDEFRRLVMIHPKINTVFHCKEHPTEKGSYQISVDPSYETLLCISDKEEKLYLRKLRKLPEDFLLRLEQNQLPFSNHEALKKLLMKKIAE